MTLGWQHTLSKLTLAMICVIGTAILSGATLGHLGMPALIQPTHLLAASLLFGLQFLIWMSFRHSRDGNGLNTSSANGSAMTDGNEISA